ncbi:MAG: hypothetical protein KatS3mg123_1757 [Burkholderiales bacterium]|nr:MAG: hypothetical protein KatS3mg123_1757 [Burkholderiales bacterium]
MPKHLQMVIYDIHNVAQCNSSENGIAILLCSNHLLRLTLERVSCWCD